MISYGTAKASNERAKSLSDLVVVFVGGTGGIGESTLKELFTHSTRPKAYIVGRNEAKAHELIAVLHTINPSGLAIFLPKDIALLRNVDELCDDLKTRETKINGLFLTAGFMSIKGRTETDEGIDRKMSANYYSRMRWILNLMPLLTAASQAGQLSRVNSVLGAGSEGDVVLDDLDLKRNYGLYRCLAHCVVMTDFMIENLAEKYPGTSFSHSYPGTVKTGIANELSGPIRLAVKVMYALSTPWIINVQESGARHFFQLTSRCYPAASGPTGGVPIPEGMATMKGTNGKIGSGAYLLDWDGSPAGDEAVLRKYREQNMCQRVWDHTISIFQQADQKKDALEREARRSSPGGDVPNPVGWRPG